MNAVQSVDDSVIDDQGALERLDPGQMLRAIATGGAQVREAAQIIQRFLILLTEAFLGVRRIRPDAWNNVSADND